jgi:hypothetical protein
VHRIPVPGVTPEPVHGLRWVSEYAACTDAAGGQCKLVTSGYHVRV